MKSTVKTPPGKAVQENSVFRDPLKYGSPTDLRVGGASARHRNWGSSAARQPLEGARIGDDEAVNRATTRISRRDVPGEVVERMTVERRLPRPVGTGKGRQLRGVEACRKRASSGGEHRPGGQTASIGACGDGRRGSGSDGVLGEDVQGSPRRVGQVPDRATIPGHDQHRVERVLDHEPEVGRARLAEVVTLGVPGVRVPGEGVQRPPLEGGLLRPVAADELAEVGRHQTVARRRCARVEDGPERKAITPAVGDRRVIAGGGNIQREVIQRSSSRGDEILAKVRFGREREIRPGAIVALTRTTIVVPTRVAASCGPAGRPGSPAASGDRDCSDRQQRQQTEASILHLHYSEHLLLLTSVDGARVRSFSEGDTSTGCSLRTLISYDATNLRFMITYKTKSAPPFLARADSAF